MSFTRKVKKIALLLFAVLFFGTMGPRYSGDILLAQAHQGRTDSQGGHHDYKNKSGLGNYHYHHGYSAHLHPNGVCPYENSSGTSSESSKETSGSVAEKKTEPALNIKDYNLVFNSSYYYKNNSDLQTTVLNDEQKLLEHFVNYGMAEGRKGCSDFDVMIYKNNNLDLETAFGDDLKKYYEHFINCGYSENRIHN